MTIYRAIFNGIIDINTEDLEFIEFASRSEYTRFEEKDVVTDFAEVKLFSFEDGEWVTNLEVIRNGNL